jgi:uncharacterized alkaline shock family protein YloU
MKRMLFRCILFCCHLVLLFFALACSMGVLALLAHAPLQDRLLAALPDLMASHEQAPWVLVAAMGVLAVVLMAAWMELLLLHRPRAVLSFNTLEGTVCIATATVARFVREVIKSSRGVVQAQVDTAVDGRKMSVTARVRFTDELPVTQLATDAQRAVRQRVQDVFGCDLVQDIRIEVAGVDINKDRPRRMLSWRAQAAPSLTPPSVPGV